MPTTYLNGIGTEGLLEAEFPGADPTQLTSSFQLLGADLRLGGAVGGEGKKLAPIMGNVKDPTTVAATAISTKPIVVGVLGAYSLTNAHASTYPVGAVGAQISDGVDDDAVHGFVAYIDGDSALTQAGAAFKVMHNNSVPSSGFKHGLDLSGASHDGYNAVSYREADIKLASGGLIVSLDTAITANTTTTTLAAGTLGKTTHATGRASLFVSDGTKWQYLTNS